MAQSKVLDIFERDFPPEIIPGGPGRLVTRIAISIKALPGADVRFTTDGTDPSDSATALPYRTVIEIMTLGPTGLLLKSRHLK